MKSCGILEIASEYVGANPMSAGREEKIFLHARAFEERWPNVDTGTLAAKHLNEFVKIQENIGRKPGTVRNYRNTILMLWRYAFETGRATNMPFGVRRVKVPKPEVEAFTDIELRRLRAGCDKIQGSFYIGGRLVQRGTWLRAYVSGGLSTGLRQGDMLALEWANIDRKGRFVIRESKTGKLAHRRLDATALKDARRLRKETGSPLVYPWEIDRTKISTLFDKLKGRSGVRRGTLRWLRKAGATRLRMQGRDSQAFCNHSAVATTDGHYIDPSQATPELVEGPKFQW